MSKFLSIRFLQSEVHFSHDLLPANTLIKIKNRSLILQLIGLLALTFANRRFEIQSGHENHEMCRNEKNSLMICAKHGKSPSFFVRIWKKLAHFL